MILQVHVGSESTQPAASQGGQGSKPAKRMPAPTVPAEVKHVVAIFKPYFDPALFPKVSLPVLHELYMLRSHTASQACCPQQHRDCVINCQSAW